MIISTIPKSTIVRLAGSVSFVVALLLLSTIANAATITVTTRLDPAGPSGTCSLRQAIMNANGNNHSGSQDCVAGSGTDTIVFSTQDNIILTSALPAITQSLNIVSSSPGKLISGATRLQIFTVNPNATLTIKNLLLIDADSILEGSAIQNRATSWWKIASSRAMARAPFLTTPDRPRRSPAAPSPGRRGGRWKTGAPCPSPPPPFRTIPGAEFSRNILRRFRRRSSMETAPPTSGVVESPTRAVA